MSAAHTSALGRWVTRPIHISLIRPGDTVEFNGSLKTVSPGAIREGFMGTTLWGDSYQLGTRPVQLANFAKATGEQP